LPVAPTATGAAAPIPVIANDTSRLAEAAGVSLAVLKRFERGSDPRASTVNAIERALVDAGVTLIDDGAVSPAGAGAGVRLTRRAGGKQ
jgi:hypothetical protein